MFAKVGSDISDFWAILGEVQSFETFLSKKDAEFYKIFKNIYGLGVAFKNV